MLTKRLLSALVIACVISSLGFAQEATPLREVKGNTIFSGTLPSADLTVGKEFHYEGGQRVNLYGNADAEQHLFVTTTKNGVVERFVWVQFEHFFPTNTYTYNYPADHTINLGGLDSVYDSKGVDDWAAQVSENPASDGAAIARLLSKHNLRFPTQVARIRMFHLPTPYRRTELMVIYGKAISSGSGIPFSRDSVVLDKDAPDAARHLLEELRRDLTVKAN